MIRLILALVLVAGFAHEANPRGVARTGGAVPGSFRVLAMGNGVALALGAGVALGD